MSHRQWQRVAIGAGAAMFLGMGLGRFSYSTMIPALIKSGALDVVAAGYVGGANMVGFLIGAATSTVAAKLFRIDRLLFGVIIAGLIGLAASALPWGAIWLGGWRGIIGFATGCIMVLGLAVTAQSAPPEHRARAMSYIFIGVGCGILFGGTIVPATLAISITAAWVAVAIAGAIAGCTAIVCWRDVHQTATPDTSIDRRRHDPVSARAWYAVIAASFLFSLGLVPHTIYWFDYLARELDLGYTIAGWHWAGVGVFAILGPIAVAWLANKTTTTIALAVTFFVLAAGLAAPWYSQAAAALIASTIIFGAQPAISTLLGARARDLGSAAHMPGMMRTIILSNGIGSAMAGVAVPKLLGLTGSYELLFLLAGGVIMLGGILCAPAVFNRLPSSPSSYDTKA